MNKQFALAVFQHRDGVRAAHRRKAVQKFIQRQAVLQIFKQRLHRHARPTKHRRTAHDFRVHFNVLFHVHASTLNSPKPGRKEFQMDFYAATNLFGEAARPAIKDGEVSSLQTRRQCRWQRRGDFQMENAVMDDILV